MKVWKRTLPVWLLILVMLLTACGTPSQSSQPDSTEGWRKAYEETGAYLQAQTAPTAGSIGGEWAVIGLSRAGLLSNETAQSYEQTVEDYVKQAGSVRLHHAKSTENSRTILGLTAAGYNAANVAGVDLTAGLTDMAYLRAQGTNGPIWALIALDCHGYDIPQCADGEEQVTREGLVAEILSYQCSDGGWALMGDESDVDMTAMALTALAPYQEETDVKAAVEQVFGVKVEAVNVVNVKGKAKAFRQRLGHRNDWRKAYVTLAEGQSIDVMTVSA